ncbi:MAG: sigma-70 family RNA polymerase sigma factor [Clostridia bacterium]|nr:sigma-70 family RNA polymerase sigma factor [Clostridia bacterium]MBR5772839.1 sigma-70 family RNA polymerase sigma factor [Clostridia bacterium]
MSAEINEEALASLAKKASEGDDKAMAELVEVIMPAAKAKAAKLNSDYARISDEDLVQEGMIGFLEAVKRYDSSKGVPFRAYAGLCIESRIISALRKNSNSKNIALTSAVSIDERAEEISGEDPAALVAGNDEAARLSVFIDESLSAFEKDVLNLRLEGFSYAVIAEKLGCDEKSVDNAVQRIRNKIKKR